MHLAIIGVTGMVGRELIKTLDDFMIFPDKLIFVALEHSIEKTIIFQGDIYPIVGINNCIDQKPDIAIFMAGESISLEWAPKFAKIGCKVIDTSSAWRMDKNIKLVVPEINGYTINNDDMIIASPNCSTIQLVMALKPLSDKYGIKRVVVSTYQSVSGSGTLAINQLEKEKLEKELDHDEQVYPYKIYDNCIPHCDSFLENSYTKEEMKLTNESRKILDISDLKLTATAVRIPVSQGHSESVNIELEKAFEVNELITLLSNTTGIQVINDPKQLSYPMPLYIIGRNEVFIGRIRRDKTVENGINMWIVADNLRKGAATNALQIAEIIAQKHMFTSENRQTQV